MIQNTFSNGCKFSRTCKNKNGLECNNHCYPYVLLHGKDGTGGYWASTGIPKKYRDCLAGNLPIQQDNPEVYMSILRYISNIQVNVNERGVGLFFFSVPNKENPLGTGTGKTTTAITILNEYVLHSVRSHLKQEVTLTCNPSLFVRVSEFQNKYNGQFRGGFELQKESSEAFYNYKKKMKKVPLLVLDDIAVRDTTEAFKNELFEIIDHRATESLTTIFTSNYPLERLTDFLGERIVSRIDGMSYRFGFKGKDYRKGDLFNG